MPGGPKEAYQRVEPMLTRISAHVGDDPCCTYIGPGGAGHYVKMVHNGIEYADIQLIAEAYDLLTQALHLEAGELSKIFAEWNRGDLDSYLIQITAEVLGKQDRATGKPLVDIILDEAQQKGTGKWASQSALDLGIPLTAITEAVFARFLSALKSDRMIASRSLPGPNGSGQPASRSLIDDVRSALYASKVVAYAQGFEQMQAASNENGWDLQLGSIAGIWRGGCIIRARFLNRITDAYAADPKVKNLLLVPYFHDAMAQAQAAWRRVISLAVERGIPVPAFSSSLAYYDAYRRERLPANLVQGLRDYFGAHSYRRTDREGSFHTRWAQGGDEVELKH
jgi:6-phosphogluconate dehydrogenase